MLEIKPILAVDKVKKICLVRHVVYRDGVYVMLATNQNDELGGIIFFVQQDQSKILLLWAADESDAGLVDGIVRAAASFSYNRGSACMVCNDKEYETCLQSIGFHENEGMMAADLPQFFNKCTC